MSFFRRAGALIARFFTSAADPAAAAAEFQLYSKDAGGVSQLFGRSDDGTVHQITPMDVVLKDQPIADNGPSPSMQFTALVVNPAGTRCYVNGAGTDPIWYFSTATNLWNVATAPVTIPFSNARTLLFNLAGTKLYALAPNASTISIIDPVTGTVTGTIAGLPAGVFSFMALNPSGTELWVSDISGPGSIHRVDTATDTFIATFASTAGNPFHLVFNPAGTKAYLNVTPNLGFSARLVIFDTTTYLPIATFSDTPVYRNLVALPDGTEVWSCKDGVFPAPDEVIRISVATDLIVGAPILSSQANSSGPYQLIARADSSKVYSLLVSGDIDVITVASASVTATVNTASSFAGQIAINPANTFLYASNPQLQPYSVIVIDLGTELVSDTVNGGSIVQPAPTTIGAFDAFRITGAQLSDDGGGQAAINLPVVFDEAGTAFTNIKANRPFPYQSIDDQTKSGITNLGCGSTCSADFATIGGGTGNVASGLYSTVAGGQLNTASGENSFAAGGFNDATGDTSVAMGEGCLASGPQSIAMGTGCTASGVLGAFAVGDGTTASGESAVATGNGTQAGGDWAAAFGNGCSANGVGAFAFGDGCSASGQYTFAGCEGSVAIGDYSAALNSGITNGVYSTALNIGRTAAAAEASFAHGIRSDATRPTQKAFAGGSNAYGTRQTSELVLRGSTPGAAINESVELLFGGFAAAGSTQLILEDLKAYAFVVTAVIGGVQTGPVRRSRSIEIKFNARRDGGTTVITASGTTDAYGDASTATWTLTPTVGAAPDRIVLTFNTGAGAASDCEVVAKVEFTEVTY